MAKQTAQAATRMAVIRIRSSIGRHQEIKKTLQLLRLHKTNHCVIIDDRDTFKGMLQKAKDVGFNPIKLNFVIMKDLNHEELETFINFCAENGFILQIIELHKVSETIGGNLEFYEKHHLDIKPIIEMLEARAVEVKVRGSMQNRKVITLSNSAVVETITPSHEFCMGCTKLRVGCDGNLFGCLYRSDLGKNIKEALRNQHSLSRYEQIVKQVLDSREPYY